MVKSSLGGSYWTSLPSSKLGRMKVILINDHVSVLRDKLMEYPSSMHFWFFILSTNRLNQGSYGNLSINNGFWECLKLETKTCCKWTTKKGEKNSVDSHYEILEIVCNFVF